MDAGYTGAPPPWQLVKARLLQFYGCLPSQLNDEPADEVMQLWSLNQTFEEYAGKRSKRELKPLKKGRHA